MTMNKMLIIGNLGSDPEMRYTPSGQAVTSFRVATNYRYNTAEGERRDETEWFTISAWGKLGELTNQYLSKGGKVYVEGRLKSRSYETRDGETRFVNEISATEVRFIDSTAARGDEPPNNTEQEGEPPTDVDDLPF